MVLPIMAGVSSWVSPQAVSRLRQIHLLACLPYIVYTVYSGGQALLNLATSLFALKKRTFAVRAILRKIKGLLHLADFTCPSARVTVRYEERRVEVRWNNIALHP